VISRANRGGALLARSRAKGSAKYVESDIAEADRASVIRNFISGQYSDALRVVAFNTAEGWSRDVSEDIANEDALSMATRTSLRTRSGLSIAT
jgi:hypothetical protein